MRSTLRWLPRSTRSTGSGSGLLHDRRLNGDKLLWMVTDLIKENYEISDVTFVARPNPSDVSPPEMLDELAEKADAALIAIGGLRLLQYVLYARRDFPGRPGHTDCGDNQRPVHPWRRSDSPDAWAAGVPVRGGEASDRELGRRRPEGSGEGCAATGGGHSD